MSVHSTLCVRKFNPILMTESLQSLFSSDLEARKSPVGPPWPLQLCPQSGLSLPLLPLHPYRHRRGGRHPLSGSLVHCSVQIRSQEFIVMLRQLSYAINNQLKAPKAPYLGLSCLSLVLYGIRAPIITFPCMEATYHAIVMAQTFAPA